MFLEKKVKSTEEQTLNDDTVEENTKTKDPASNKITGEIPKVNFKIALIITLLSMLKNDSLSIMFLIINVIININLILQN